jgi:hypothetical protein
MNEVKPSASTSDPLAYTAGDRVIEEFVSRGFVVLSPESLGISLDVHDRIFEHEKDSYDPENFVFHKTVPEVLELLNAPGLVAACNKIVGENWAIVPFTHTSGYVSGPRNQHWHKDDNGPYNSRKQRHHQANQIEMLYYPQAVLGGMGPTVVIPYSQYWTVNHEENHDNFAGADHLDFDYTISGPDSKFDVDDIIHRRTPHDVRMREAVSKTGWPLVAPFEIAPLRAGTVVLTSHNIFHRREHRRDDWRTWPENPRFMWRFWIYRTTEPSGNPPGEIDWYAEGVDPLTKIDLSDASEDITTVWRHHHHWIKSGEPPPPRLEMTAKSADEREVAAHRMFEQLRAKHDESEPARIGAAYRIASIRDTSLAVRLLGQALYDERESVRRAATYGLVAVGPDAMGVLLEAVSSPVKWVRKAGVYGLGDASPLTDEVLRAIAGRLRGDPSVYVRSVAAGSLGCLGRRASGSGLGAALIPECTSALIESLAREQNRHAMDVTQRRSIKFVRPTDDCDVCEGMGIDFGHERFKPVRSAVRENALWSLVILCSHSAEILGHALEPTIETMKNVIRHDDNVFCVGFAMDALNRLANLTTGAIGDSPPILELRSSFPDLIREAPMQCWDSLIRGGLPIPH